jgi:hypothetical protein
MQRTGKDRTSSSATGTQTCNWCSKSSLCRRAFNYSVGPKLDGIITLDLKKVTFDEALGVVLKQVDGAWRIEDGKYVIVRVLTARG